MDTEDTISLGAALVLQTGGGGNPWIVGLAVAWLVGDFLWNALRTQDVPTPAPSGNISLPTVSEGSVVPLFYGHVVVTVPVLVWTSAPTLVGPSTDGQGQTYFLYEMDMIFVAGSSFQRADTKLISIHFGSVPARHMTDTANQEGYGGFESKITYDMYSEVGLGFAINTPDQAIAGYAQILNGRPEQTCVSGSSATNWVGDVMIRHGETPSHVRSFRGYVTVALFGTNATTDQAHWTDKPMIPAVAFRILAKPQAGGLLHQIDDTEFGCNPVDVLYDLLTGTFNKLGLDTARIATSEWTACAVTCEVEKLLYSRVIDSATTVEDAIGEILAHINGIMYEDQSDGLIHLKLLRADYDPTALRTIDPTNCIALDSFQMTTWSEVPNMITVRYTDPVTGTVQSVSQSSQATAVGQDGELRETILSYPGCTNRDEALDIASRELQIRSRPIMKCRVMTTREFDDLTPGMPVYLSWPKLNISSLVFRVLNLTSGVLNDGKITINLVQDVFYVHKKHPPFPIGDIGSPTWTISF